MRKEYKLTEAQYKQIVEASKPVPYMIIGSVPPVSSQESANLAWCELGKELGFDGMSVEPVVGKNKYYFTAKEEK